MARVRTSGASVARRPVGVKRIRAVSPATAKRPVARSAAAYMALRAKGKPSRPVVGGKVPRINVQVPKLDFNPGKAIGDAFSHFAPQDVLFRKIGDRLKNPSGR